MPSGSSFSSLHACRGFWNLYFSLIFVRTLSICHYVWESGINASERSFFSRFQPNLLLVGDFLLVDGEVVFAGFRNAFAGIECAHNLAVAAWLEHPDWGSDSEHFVRSALHLQYTRKIIISWTENVMLSLIFILQDGVLEMQCSSLIARSSFCRTLVRRKGIMQNLAE